MFGIKRGTKQGDPLSSSLLNTVLQVALKDDQVNLQTRGMGMRLGDSELGCLTNLRFASDVLLFSISPEQLQRMGGTEDPSEKDEKIPAIRIRPREKK